MLTPRRSISSGPYLLPAAHSSNNVMHFITTQPHPQFNATFLTPISTMLDTITLLTRYRLRYTETDSRVLSAVASINVYLVSLTVGLGRMSRFQTIFYVNFRPVSV